LWQKLGAEIYNFLSGITLSSFLARERVREVVRRQRNAVPVEAPVLNKTMAG
jgi:hypothetical protein